MACSFNVSHWFNREAFSDVTIKFGDREAKCHKMILFSKSEYFRTMLAPDSKFQERDLPVIELKEDNDLDAVEAVLAYIYEFSYIDQFKARNTDPMFHFYVLVAAKKYLVAELEAKALTNFKEAADALTEIRDILDLLDGHREYRGQCDDADNHVKGIAERNLAILILHPRFQDMLFSDDLLMALIVDTIKSNSKPMLEVKMIKCTDCKIMIPKYNVRGNEYQCCVCDKTLYKDGSSVSPGRVLSYWK